MIDLGSEIQFGAEIESMCKEENKDWEELNEREKQAKRKEMTQYVQTAAQEISQQQDEEYYTEYQKMMVDRKFTNFLLMSNLPQGIQGERAAKLTNILKMIMEKRGLKADIVEVTMGFTKEGLSNGFALLEFVSEESVKKAVSELNNLVLDKSHTLKTYTLSEYDAVLATPEELEQPAILKLGDLQSWSVESSINEQILFRTQNNSLHVGWVDHLQDRINPLAWEKRNESESNEGTLLTAIREQEITKVEFSQQGSYLVVMHPSGFSLYGGDTFQFLTGFAHQDVKHVVFSNDEQFIISYNGTVLTTTSQENCIVWNAQSGKKLRAFKAEGDEAYQPGQREHMLFSPDSEYLVKKGPKQGYLSFYSLRQDCKLKKTMDKLPNIQSLAFWCPNTPGKKQEQLLLVFCYDKKSCARVALVEMDSLGEHPQLRWKTINQQVSHINHHSDHQLGYKDTMAGLFLLQENRKNKNKRNVQVQFGMFNRKKLEIEDKDMGHKYKYMSMAQNKVVMVNEEHNSASGHTRWDFDFFIVHPTNSRLTQINSLKNRLANQAVFSSIPEFFVLVNKESMSPTQGTLEFCQLKVMDQGQHRVDIIKEQRMDYMNEVQYDPSGRFLMAMSRQTNSVKVFNSYGKIIYKQTFNNLNQVVFRNRPFVDITRPIFDKVLSSFKDYQKAYEDEDDRIINSLKYLQEEKQKLMKLNFMEFISQKRSQWAETKAKRVAMLGFDEDNIADLVVDTEQVDQVVLESQEITDQLE